MSFKNFRRLTLLLQCRVLDFIENPRQLQIICLASPRLAENNYYWRERYKDFFREFTNNLDIDNYPRAIYHAFMVRALILEDVQDRRTSLSRALNQVGLYIRSDSKLCSQWIKGLTEPKWTEALVVKKCIEMKWLFDYCDFKRKMHDYLREQKLSYSDQALSQASAHFLALKPVPEVLPWISQKTPQRPKHTNRKHYGYYDEYFSGLSDDNSSELEYDSDYYEEE